jgi:hypothetical protein
MFWLALIVVGCLLLWLVVSIRKKARRANEIEAAGSSLDREKVEADYHLEVAAWCKDRMNELDGPPHGPGERVKLRFQILNEIKRLAG